MALLKQGTIIDLAVRESVPLTDLRGTTLRVTRGTLWVTQQDDTQDIVLRAGDNWTVERNGLTLVEAQQDATFCVLGRYLEAAVLPAPRMRGTWTSAWRQLRAFAIAQFVAPMRRSVPHY
ncbi:MAG: DUF2917 domain-containing protein [Burkholderiales bacterium]